MSQHRLIGKDVGRVDVPSKTTGKAQYGIDVRLPGCSTARCCAHRCRREAGENRR